MVEILDVHKLTGKRVMQIMDCKSTHAYTLIADMKADIGVKNAYSVGDFRAWLKTHYYAHVVEFVKKD